MLDNLIQGFGTALTPLNLLLCLVGVALGTAIGVLPGLGAATGIAILIPLTLSLEPVSALIMLAGIYYGSQYGSTITAVLIATPGETSSVSTVLDGYQMARNGRAGAALAVSALASFVAAILSLVLLVLLAPPLASLALNFGPPEMLAIMVLGLTTIVAFSGGRRLLGVGMALLGLLLSTVGVDAGTGTPRFTQGSVELLSGLPLVEVMIGLFALGEVFNQLHAGSVRPIKARFRDLLLTKEDIKRATPATLRGSLVGFVLGVLPGAGSTLASFMAYGAEKRFSRHRDELGRGAIEGVASPEAANNSAANANFVPTLTLGVPGGATTAILLSAFLIYGITPGPLLFEEQPVVVWGLLASFFIGNVMLLVLNLPLAPVFAQLLRVPYAYMFPLVITTSLVGAYSTGNSMFNVALAFLFGIVGYVMKRVSLPIAPLVLGLVIGPLFEKALVQTSALGRGDLTIILQHPIALGIVGAMIAISLTPIAIRKVRKVVGGQSARVEISEEP